MKALILYSYFFILFQWAKGAPVEDVAAPDGSVPDGTVLNDDGAQPTKVLSQASDLVISKAAFDDILVDDGTSLGGFENITLMEVPPAPKFMFNFSTEARDYTVNPKYTAFLERLSKLVTGNTYDKDQYAKEADELKSQYADLRATIIEAAAQKEPSLGGEVEIFNTTAYYYKLMRYHEALLKKDAEEEFHHHDTKCVVLFIDQLEFEISMLGFLAFDGKFLLSTKNGDPKELLVKTKEQERALELRLGKLFFERSQVFEFNMRQFSRHRKLVKQLDVFVNGPEAESTTDDDASAAIAARSVKDDPKISLFRTYKNLNDLSSRLDVLEHFAAGMHPTDLDSQVRASEKIYDNIDRYALETSGKQVSEIPETQVLSDKVLQKIESLNDFDSKRYLETRDVYDTRSDEVYGEDSIFTIWNDSDERTR